MITQSRVLEEWSNYQYYGVNKKSRLRVEQQCEFVKYVSQMIIKA